MYYNKIDFDESHLYTVASDVAGYSWSRYFCFEPIMDSDFINKVCEQIWGYTIQKPGMINLGIWHFFTCDHWGGAEIARGNSDRGLLIHQKDYLKVCSKPEFMFWQDILTYNTTMYSRSTKAPSVWRSYYQMTGYLLDKDFQRLWILPSLPSEMKGKLINAPLPAASRWGTLNYEETPISGHLQNIDIRFDSNVTVRELIFKDNSADSLGVKLDCKVGGNIVQGKIERKQRGIEKIFILYLHHLL